VYCQFINVATTQAELSGHRLRPLEPVLYVLVTAMNPWKLHPLEPVLYVLVTAMNPWKLRPLEPVLYVLVTAMVGFEHGTFKSEWR
jgi:hypothetical protein